MDTLQESFYTEDQRTEILADVRGLLHEYPFLEDRDAETVRRMLLMLRGVAISEFEVAVALEGLSIEDEVLA
ncbi:MAG: hypothetical protein WKF67_12750 [Rubrobacteraceae bacterium]